MCGELNVQLLLRYFGGLTKYATYDSTELRTYSKILKEKKGELHQHSALSFIITECVFSESFSKDTIIRDTKH